jgi:ribosome-binding factor A
MNVKDEKAAEILRHCAAEFLARESNHTSLITVTKVELGVRGGTSSIFFTVLPETAQQEALEFLKRRRSDFREYLKSHTRMQRLPFIDFKIDFGEKNRQKIEDLSQNI